jgi:hypothetical protein
MPSDDPRPVARAIFSRRETILLAAAAMTITATLTVLLSRLTLDEVSSPRFQREYVFVRNAPYDRMDGRSFCGATSGRPIHGATRSIACRSPKPRSPRSRAAGPES